MRAYTQRKHIQIELYVYVPCTHILLSKFADDDDGSTNNGNQIAVPMPIHIPFRFQTIYSVYSVMQISIVWLCCFFAALAAIAVVILGREQKSSKSEKQQSKLWNKSIQIDCALHALLARSLARIDSFTCSSLTISLSSSLPTCT